MVRNAINLHVKVDDKDGLVEDGPYKDSPKNGTQAKKGKLPKLCNDGVPCQKVDSRVSPKPKKKKDKRKGERLT